MKKLIITFQILTLLSQSVRADDTSVRVAQPTAVLEETIIPKMPKDYTLPNMLYVGPEKKKSIFKQVTSFFFRFKDKNGNRIDVQGEVGRFGSNWGDGFKEKIYHLQRESGEKVIFILTLSSTRNAAKILKQKMALEGREALIIDIPDEAQKYILEKAEAKAAGGFKELWWDTKDKYGKLINIKETISNSKKILRNQFVKPNADDLGLVRVSLGATAFATVAMVTLGNVDPGLALTMAAMRALIGGTSLYYHRTIANLFRFNIFDEFTFKSSTRQTLSRLTLMGLGIGEIYYLMGSHLAGPSYGMTQRQLLTNTLTSGFVETAGATERTNRLSDVANRRMIIYSILLGAGISTASMVGAVGPILVGPAAANPIFFDNGIIEISTLQGTALVVYTGLLLSYKYLTHRVEKIAQHDLIEIGKEKWQRFFRIRAAHYARIAKEKQAALEAKNRVEELKASIKNDRALRGHNHITMCARLFQ
ncbi:MAG: DUF349 domain-containing protein [Bdellovibrionota bacterium]